MNRDKGFMIRVKAVALFAAICMFLFGAIVWLVIDMPAPAPAGPPFPGTAAQAPTPAPVVSYDKIEILYVGGKSAFRTPDGWNFAGPTGQNDGTVFIKKRVRE